MSDVTEHTDLNLSLYNETLTLEGTARPHWQQVTDRLNAFEHTQIEQRQRDIARQLRANGLAYSLTSDATHTPRPWSLDLAPFVLEAADWRTISQGLEQRARLKQYILDDLYGSQKLLRHGLIPPALVYAHNGYLRDAVNIDAAMELPLFSADLSRAPSGEWYVVDDLCKYPEGVGYALENRLVLSRTLPLLFRDLRVMRVASYFKQLQQRVSELAEVDGRCVILAYGPGHPHYFEHAFLAKYLGYTMVQAGDLTVRSQRVYLKTVSGLQRVSVIIRLINDIGLDPMAVGQPQSRGITGLFQAVSTGGVRVINPLGSGVLDNPALSLYLPRLCQHIFGEDLLLQGPPIYWLGNDKEREHVLSRTESLLFRQIDGAGTLKDPQLMTHGERSQLIDQIKLVPHRFVAQERISRSLAPAFNGPYQVQRQVTLRCFLVRRDKGYESMPGALCQLDTEPGGRRPSFEHLDGSKDTWVIAQGPLRSVSLLDTRSEHNTAFAVIDGELPSRVAEDLFWMGRNAERSENCVRMLRSAIRTLQNEEAVGYDDESSIISPVMSAILRATSMSTGTLPGFAGRGGKKRMQRPHRELASLLQEASRPGTLPFTLMQLQNSASLVRDRISDELMQILNRLDDSTKRLINEPVPQFFVNDQDVLQNISEQLNDTLMYLSAFTGQVHENFTHSDGWRYLMLGRTLERIVHSCVTLSIMLDKNRHDSLLLETLLKHFDSVMTYRSRYRSEIDVRLVLKLLLVDEFNPRSLAFLFKEVQDSISLLPGRRALPQADPLSRLTIAGLSRLQLVDTRELVIARNDARQNLSRLLKEMEKIPLQIADILGTTYFSHVENGQPLANLSPLTNNPTHQH